jgi:hypothetical protein
MRNRRHRASVALPVNVAEATGRPLAVRLREHMHNLKEDAQEK